MDTGVRVGLFIVLRILDLFSGGHVQQHKVNFIFRGKGLFNAQNHTEQSGFYFAGSFPSYISP